MDARKQAVAWTLAVASLCGAAGAGEIYRWVDGQGRVQLSDRPPPDGRSAARQPGRPTAPLQDVQPGSKPQQAARPVAAASQPVAASAPDDQPLPPRAGPEDCRLWRAEYARSQACYSRYRTRYGLKAEAESACGPEVLNPEFECKHQYLR